MAADILVVKENSHADGNDLIIGDIHGNNEAFNKVLSSLKQPGNNDRLFPVGDLADRGNNSVGVIRDIIQFQKEHPGRLFVTRGNHENLCLNCIKGIEQQKNVILAFRGKAEDLKNMKEQLKKDHPELRDDEISKRITEEIDKYIQYIINNPNNFGGDIANTIVNGGEWIIKLYLKELMEGKISIDVTGNEFHYNNSDIKEIYTFMRNLPYITHVEGKTPFNVVHADNPLSDEDMQKRINDKNLTLSDTEREHATWARQEEILKNRKRNANSVLTYVGHNQISNEFSVVRAETNTVNLDVSAWKNNFILVANHTLGKCYYIGIESHKAINRSCDFVPMSPSADQAGFEEALSKLKSKNAYVKFGDSLLYGRLVNGQLASITEIQLDNTKEQQINEKIIKNHPENIPFTLTTEQLSEITNISKYSMYLSEQDKLNNHYKAQRPQIESVKKVQESSTLQITSTLSEHGNKDTLLSQQSNTSPELQSKKDNHGLAQASSQQEQQITGIDSKIEKPSEDESPVTSNKQRSSS